MELDAFNLLFYLMNDGYIATVVGEVCHRVAGAGGRMSLVMYLGKAWPWTG